jgi:integrase
MVVASAVDERGEQIYTRKWNHDFIDLPTGTHKAGNHAFRRFRNTYLRNYTDCPEGLYKYWMGHAGRDMSDLCCAIIAPSFEV